MNRILLIVAAVCFGLAALSAFSDAINVNELGFLALGLLAYALGAARRRRRRGHRR